MLAETCPDCMVPLMRSPDKLIEKCVVCEKNFKKNDEPSDKKDGDKGSKDGQIDSSAKSKSDDKGKDPQGRDDVDDEYGQMIKEYEKSAGATGDGDKAIQQKQPQSAHKPVYRGRGMRAMAQQNANPNTSKVSTDTSSTKIEKQGPE